MRFIDLTGQRFGRLVASAYVPKNGKGKGKWLCKCDCGGTTRTAASDLKSGKSESCGCLKNEQLIKRRKTHGMSRSGEHYSWTAMKHRCLNPNAQEYARYGGRGITIDPRWVNSFETFLEDMGMRPTPQHTLERIDNDKGYSKDNCKWATRLEQSRNRSSTLRYMYNGKEVPLREIAEKHGISFGMLLQRLTKQGLTLQEALERPPRR